MAKALVTDVSIMCIALPPPPPTDPPFCLRCCPMRPMNAVVELGEEWREGGVLSPWTAHIFASLVLSRPGHPNWRGSIF